MDLLGRNLSVADIKIVCEEDEYILKHMQIGETTKHTGKSPEGPRPSFPASHANITEMTELRMRIDRWNGRRSMSL
jgi:hypothetical protein